MLWNSQQVCLTELIELTLQIRLRTSEVRTSFVVSAHAMSGLLTNIFMYCSCYLSLLILVLASRRSTPTFSI